MAFTALTGSASHFAIGELPNMKCLVLCVLFTLIFALIAARLANKAKPETLNRTVGVILLILGISVLSVSFLK